jgi:hypothetical protein
MKIFIKVKTEAVLSDFVPSDQKDFCYQTHRGNSQLKISHVLKAGIFSQKQCGSESGQVPELFQKDSFTSCGVSAIKNSRLVPY